MIKIGDFAKICNVSTQTLRYYDAEGILKADVIDPSSGYRFYSIDAVEKYKKILFYKNLGFSLDEIKKTQHATNDQLQALLKKKKESLIDSIERCKKQLKAIDDLCQGGPEKPRLSEILLLPFENDAKMVGKWKLCGKLSDETDLTSLEEITTDIADKEIVFMPGGAFAWKYFWTKGILYRISPKYKFAIPNSYRTLERDGVLYMIVHFLSNDCLENGKDASVLLYRQLDRIAYTEQQLRPNIDKTDFPFVEDEAILGEWTAIDLLPDISNFDPHKKYSNEKEIYTESIHFLPRGICTKAIRTLSGHTTELLRYTKGFVLNDKEMTAEEYHIKSINNQKFLFVQHKCGDYFYGGMTPYWYVFERKEN